MKKISSLYQPSFLKRSLLITAPFILTQSAWAVITVDFTEIAAGVRITFSGTLNTMVLTDTTASTFSFGGFTNTTGIIARNGSSFSQTDIGTASSSALTFNLINNTQSGDIGFFGFNETSLFWEAIHIASSQSPGNVTQLNVSPSNATFTAPGETLLSLGVSNVSDGTVLWTANGTGDTFIFSSTPIPEPSSSLLITIAGLGLLKRKR